MTAIVEHALTRAVPTPDERSWLRWGAATFVGVETVHLAAGAAVNDWEGWRTFFEVASFVVVSGLVIVALVFGVLVRWGLKPSPRERNRPALAALAAGLLSVAGYAALFTWAHLLIAPAAVLLGRAGLARAPETSRGHAYAVAGALLGLASFVVGAGVWVYAVFNGGDYPSFLG